MKLAQIIVGSGFGDEGKGLMTDYFCHFFKSYDPIVIRYNGGAQAGHTVVTPSNKRHVFSHFGSGSLLNRPTFLSKEFIVNPILYLRERKIINTPVVYVHPNARVTTPYDMLLNQIIENHRTQKHGSCGVGIYETILRHQSIPITVESLPILESSYQNYCKIMDSIKEYAYNRLSSLDIEVTNDIKELFNLEVKYRFFNDMSLFANDIVMIKSPKDLTDMYIFEGAQGLLLSEKHSDGPHLTPSDPGIHTPLSMCDEIGVKHATVCYVTRCYTTRHGNGPLTNEKTLDEMGLKVDNETNITNEYQGHFRYAPLMVEDIQNAMYKDFSQSLNFNMHVNKQLAITCVDQLPTFDGTLSVSAKSYIDYIKRELNADTCFYSIGPTRNHINRF